MLIGIQRSRLVFVFECRRNSAALGCQVIVLSSLTTIPCTCSHCSESSSPRRQPVSQRRLDEGPQVRPAGGEQGLPLPAASRRLRACSFDSFTTVSVPTLNGVSATNLLADRPVPRRAQEEPDRGSPRRRSSGRASP